MQKYKYPDLHILTKDLLMCLMFSSRIFSFYSPYPSLYVLDNNVYAQQYKIVHLYSSVEKVIALAGLSCPNLKPEPFL